MLRNSKSGMRGRSGPHLYISPAFGPLPAGATMVHTRYGFPPNNAARHSVHKHTTTTLLQACRDSTLCLRCVVPRRRWLTDFRWRRAAQGGTCRHGAAAAPITAPAPFSGPADRTLITWCALFSFMSGTLSHLACTVARQRYTHANFAICVSAARPRVAPGVPQLSSGASIPPQASPPLFTCAR